MAITLTNAQAQGFNGNVIAKLFSEPLRAFPIADAFYLADMIQQAQDRQKVYRNQVKKIIDAHGGVPDKKTGLIQYPDDDARVKAVEEVDQLNEAIFEIQGNPVVIKPDWPNLTLVEMSILKPLITMESLPKTE